jgi:cytochrome P450
MGGTDVGLHGCIGRRFAETEMKVMLAVLVGSFEFGKVDGWTAEKYSLITVRPKNGMYLHVRKV